jgi:hypothetical protein
MKNATNQRASKRADLIENLISQGYGEKTAAYEVDNYIGGGLYSLTDSARKAMIKATRAAASKNRIWLECDECGALMTKYLYTKGQGLCPRCIDAIN